MNRKTKLALTGLILGLASFACAEEQVARPARFQPFQYQYSTQELKEKYSAEVMERAGLAIGELESVNAQGPYKPTWESLGQHRCPEWYDDAKFGVMIHWGVYSVPAWYPGKLSKTGDNMYPDAYYAVYIRLPATRAHHIETWGADFEYDDFIPLFKAENYDPEAWVNLFQRAGARYAVPFVLHHDGFCHWDSAYTHRNAARMGPHRDQRHCVGIRDECGQSWPVCAG